MLRDYDLGEVDESLIGKKVRLVGWADTIREHGNVWEVLTIQDIGLISATPMPPFPPIRSVQTGEWRWFDDINFEVV